MNTILVPKVNPSSAGLPPVNQVATEILSYIFALVCGQYTATEIPHKSNHPRQILASVCSSWREVLFSSQNLWTVVRIHLPRIGSSPTRACIDGPPRARSDPGADEAKAQKFSLATSQVLERSGQLPLKCEVIGTRTFGESATSRLWNPIDCLKPHLIRIEHLKLYHCSIFARDFLTLSTGMTPKLHTLEVTGSFIKMNFCAESLRDAPKLCNLRIGRESCFSPFVPAIPLSRLTHLSAGVPCNAFYNLLGQMPNLVNGDFSLFSQRSRSAYSFDPVTPFPALPAPPSTTLVHNIRTLYLEFEGYTSARLWNGSLKLPSLRHLKFFDSTEGGNVPIGIIEDLCQCEVLESLKIRGVAYSADSLHNILRRTPRLSKLILGDEFTDWSAATPLTREMLQDMGNGALLPKLETLECQIWVNPDGDTSALGLHLDMLEERRKDTTSARHIENVKFVLENNAASRAALARLDKMKEEPGWNITSSVFEDRSRY
ncbi:hypothetical protein H0H81_006952 [Sphagnurus paluster]|uniref:F-box domain-containing protein n=1 Tax=Sphagnurus paluster TaxID=117069 RepID=A0A9P7FXQ7_9AGAR|nr:hypothetical protein H0H81_006952 [Sphagnurus paluster]